jgi:hypothetical protein
VDNTQPQDRTRRGRRRKTAERRTYLSITLCILAVFRELLKFYNDLP